MEHLCYYNAQIIHYSPPWLDLEKKKIILNYGDRKMVSFLEASEFNFMKEEYFKLNYKIPSTSLFIMSKLEGEIHLKQCSWNIVRMIKFRRLRWTSHVARMEEGRSAFNILTGTPARKRPSGSHRCR